MSITAGQTILAADFLTESEQNSTPASDSGRVAQLESDGRESISFHKDGFGDGSDGEITLDGSTDYNTFSSRSGDIYTLTRDVFANNLTINSGKTLKTDGYQIFVREKIDGAGTIDWGTPNNGGTGGSTVNSTPGTAGAAGAQSGTGRLKNNAGAAGAIGGTAGNNGGAGAPSANLNPALGSIGGSGGGSPDYGDGYNEGGVSGTITAPYRTFGKGLRFETIELFAIKSDNTLTYITNSAGGAGGSGGRGRSSGSTIAGGGGGAGGASGGTILIVARRWAGTFVIKSNGGNGGNGGSSSGAPGVTGGGGGGGGGGGVAVIIYAIKTWTGSYNLTGGTGGTGSTSGDNGTSGSTGVSYEINSNNLI